MTPLQQQILDVLQDSLSIVSRPFAAIAQTLGVSEMAILRETSALRRSGIIRRVGPILDYRALGRTSALVTAQVPEDAVEKIAAAVSALPGVSHNYLRAHRYNLWFTLQAGSDAAIESTLSRLSAEHGVAFHSLPALRFFKLDVRFPIKGSSTFIPKVSPRKVSGTVSHVTLTDVDKSILSWLQHGIEIVPSPFSFHDDEQAILMAISSLIDRGVIKRIAATIDYRRLGFTANTMFCCTVATDSVDSVGKALASLDIVSHCYERRTFPGWPYNLFAMMHAQNASDIDAAVARFTKENAIADLALLPTLREFKKSPVTLSF